ncbi:MAG: hypothetical protein HN790_07270 [Methylococcales bacterium]|nr:hypothetical protein [Methylococcales bacterium]
MKYTFEIDHQKVKTKCVKQLYSEAIICFAIICIMFAYYELMSTWVTAILGCIAAIIFADIVSSLLYLAKQIQSSLVVEENKILLISGNRTNELFFSDIINYRAVFKRGEVNEIVLNTRYGFSPKLKEFKKMSEIDDCLSNFLKRII